MNWDIFDRPVTGVLVDGDKNISATKWFNLRWMWAFGWKKVVILKVVDEALAKRGYHVGFRAIDGTTKICRTLNDTRKFKVLLGHEDVVFFAVDVRGNEIEIMVEETLPRNSSLHMGIPQF